MPVLVNGVMVLPLGQRVYQLSSKDARIGAVAVSIPFLLVLAGLISCGGAIVSQNVVVTHSFFGSLQLTAIIGYRQMRLLLSGPPDISAFDQTWSITSACPSSASNACPDFDQIGATMCISSDSFASFTASQVFGGFAVCLQLLLPALIFTNKLQSRALFCFVSWCIIIFIVISVCCAVLGLRQIENCEDNNLIEKLQQASFDISQTTLLQPGANSLIAAIVFQFLIWIYLHFYANISTQPQRINAAGLQDALVAGDGL